MPKEEEEVVVWPLPEEEAPEPIHARSMPWREGRRRSGRAALLPGGARLACAMARRRGEKGCAAAMRLRGEERRACRTG